MDEGVAQTLVVVGIFIILIGIIFGIPLIDDLRFYKSPFTKIRSHGQIKFDKTRPNMNYFRNNVLMHWNDKYELFFTKYPPKKIKLKFGDIFYIDKKETLYFIYYGAKEQVDSIYVCKKIPKSLNIKVT